MKVLVSAYACEPGKGSEPGAGWAWTHAAARDHDVWVLTRANNRASIEAALAEAPEPRLQFVYLDLPAWAMRWKRGGRGVRLYYLLWQVLAARAGRRLHRQEQFDLVHHLTFANVWLPALACLVPAPFVLGPVGGGPAVPLRLYAALGARGAAAELLLQAARRASRLNPLVRLGWRRAQLVICQNDETRAGLPARVQARAIVRPNPVSPPALLTARPARARSAVYAGRLLPWKGVALALDALALAPGWTLAVVGRGPDARRLERLAARRGLGARVTFHPWLPQDRLAELISEAAALVLPSLREDGSLVTVEAQSLGVPVVALDCGGPRALAHSRETSIALIPRGSRSAIARGLAAALVSLEDGHGRQPVDFGADELEHDLDRFYALVRTGGRALIEVAA